MYKNKNILFIVCLIALLCLAGCNDSPNTNIVNEPNNQQEENNIQEVSFKAEIIEIFDNSILVKPLEGEDEMKSSDKISVSISNISVNFNFIIGQTIEITYDGMIAESYPAQIFGTKNVELVNNNDENIVEFGGKKYSIDELSEQTLNWLKMTEEQRMLSSYYPPEFIVKDDINDADNIQEQWGITLEAQNVTPSGLTIACHQLGGTDIFELSTGSFYTIQKLEDNGFVNVEYLPHKYDIGWTSEAYIINKDSTTTWDINWEWLYGKLPAGQYRIGKEIMNFRDTGDYDQEIIYAHFEIKE